MTPFRLPGARASLSIVVALCGLPWLVSCDDGADSDGSSVDAGALAVGSGVASGSSSAGTSATGSSAGSASASARPSASVNPVATSTSQGAGGASSDDFAQDDDADDIAGDDLLSPDDAAEDDASEDDASEDDEANADDFSSDDVADDDPTFPGSDTDEVDDANGTEGAGGAANDDSAEPEPTGDAGAVANPEHCAAVADWDPAWVSWEEEVLLLVNEARAQGHNCDSEGEFGPAEPLTMNATLTCAARLHSLDMYERGFFAHNNPDGENPGARIEAAGYEWMTYGENIAQGYPSPADVVEGWLDSDGHCRNILSPDFTELGVGYHPGDTEERFGDRDFWTQNFGAPLPEDFGGGGSMSGGFFGE